MRTHLTVDLKSIREKYELSIRELSNKIKFYSHSAVHQHEQRPESLAIEVVNNYIRFYKEFDPNFKIRDLITLKE